MEVARVRGMESLKQPVEAISGVSRVALNVRVPDRVTPARGMALIEPAGWAMTTEIDVRLAAGAGQPDHQPESRRPGLPRAPRELTVHIGSARVIARLRLFDERFGRLALREAMPLHVGDRLLLRDPGAAAAAGPDRGWPAVRGATVLDVNPPPLTRRGAARSAARELATWPPVPAAADLLRRHGLLKASDLRAMGVRDAPQPVFGEWAADAEHWAALRRQLSEVVRAHAANDPLAPGMPLEAARARLGLPARQLVEALAGPPLTVRDGFVRADPAGSGQQAALPARLQDAIRQLHSDLAAKPFAAPDAGRLRDLGLDSKSMAAAARAGLLLRISEQIVLAPGAGMVAAGILGGLPQPFTTAQAREVLGTTRRVAIPLLEYLDRAGVTQRLPDDRRRLNPHRVPATSRPGMTRAQPQ
jgi:selenocysteine-specific elongation factor